MTNYYTYLYWDPIKCEYIYVGKGKGNRAYAHLYGANGKKPTNESTNPPFINRLRKMKASGVDPIIHIYPMESEKQAFEMEIKLIKHYGRRDKNTGTLWNLTDGGENPPSSKGKKRPPFSAEWLKNMSISQLGKKRPRTKEHQANLLAALNTDEWRANQSVRITAWWAKRKAAQHIDVNLNKE